MSKENESSIDMNHSASASLLGYLYQCRYALLKSLQKIRSQDEFSVSIETLDDIVFEDKNGEQEIDQIKHHDEAEINISDALPELWKTIRIWCELFLTDTLSKQNQFYLITTSTAPNNSIAENLSSSDKRDIKTAIALMNSVAKTSKNKENKSAYDIYNSLDITQKEFLFESVYILDKNPTIADIQGSLQKELYFAVDTKHINSFLQRFEGWWYKRIIIQLSNKDRQPILSNEIEAEITYLRNQFKEENLPIDDDIFDVCVDSKEYDDCVFVKQLRMIDISSRRIYFAIKDYYRAFTQRSRWIREDLLYVGELGRYETRLKDAWDRKFELMREELGDDASELEKKKAAQELYKWVEQEDLIRIRPNVNEGSISRGSYQMLSDEIKLGWHIEFVQQLKLLLEN